MNAELFKKLVSTPGISGREERIRTVVADEISGLVDDVTTDRLGSLRCVRRGNGPRVMLCAHMDSIGFLVSHIDDDGFLRISPVGGFDARTLVMQRVVVQGRRDLVGLVSPSTKPVHLLTKDEREKVPKLEELFVDVMMPAQEVKENISIGDPVSLLRRPLVTDHALTAPYLDDRLGVFVLLEALRRARETQCEIHAVVSVQEEVGLRGATTSAFDIQPDLGIALDVTIAADIPGVDKGQRPTALGAGVSVGVMDESSIADPRLVRFFTDLAETNDIPYGLEILPHGGTDAGGIQLTRAGVPVITISVPVRYVHTANEMALVSDVEATIDIMARFLESATKLSLDW